MHVHCRAGNTARLHRKVLTLLRSASTWQSAMPTWLCSSATTSWLTPAECPASSPTCTHAAAARTGTHSAGRAQRCVCTLSETEAERLQRQPASQGICSLTHTLRFTLPLGCHSSTLRSTPPLQGVGLIHHCCTAGMCIVPACSAPWPNIRSAPFCTSASCTCVPQPSPLAQPPPTWPPARRRGSTQRCARACGADPQRQPACGAPSRAWPAWHLSWKTPGPHLGGEGDEGGQAPLADHSSMPPGCLEHSLQRGTQDGLSSKALTGDVLHAGDPVRVAAVQHLQGDIE